MQAQHQRYRGAKSAARAPRKRPNRPAHRSLEIAVALLVAGVALVGCGEPAAPAKGGFICRETLTNTCVACPGKAVCVDPIACTVVPCHQGEVAFQTGDTAAGGDALAADGGDAGAADGGDAGAVDGDIGASDVSDATLADVGGPGDGGDVSVDGDGAGDADTGPIGCSAGSKGCYDTLTPALCVGGEWQPTAACAAGWACKAGGCACAGECEAIGQKTCHVGKVEAVKACELDGGGCLRWSVPVACAPDELCQGGLCQKKTTCTPPCPVGQLCSAGACKPDPAACSPACGVGQVCDAGACKGTLTCGQVMACIEQYAQGPSDQLTIDGCLAKGSPGAIAQYKARKACIALACQTLIDQGKIYEALLCVYSKCAVEQTACTGAGSTDCSGLGGCLSGCGSSSVCTSACHGKASIDAVQHWYGLLLCGEQLCGGKQGDAWAQCTASSCQAAYQTCFGSTGQGGLSCGGILKCAGGCGGSKDCAQQCKAQGSAAGLAALQALLACNDKFCGAVCASGTQQQCDGCLSFYCANQLQACQ